MLGFILLLYIGWAAFLYTQQRHILFPGADLPAPAAVPGLPHEGVEKTRLPFSSGSVEALFFPAARSGQAGPALVFAHGNGELISDNLPIGRQIAGLGISVLMVEYPGYGRSDGTPSRRAIAEVFISGFDWLSARPEVDRERIVGFGRSLGSGAITDLAGQRSLKALILQSSFLSVSHLASRYLVPGLLVRDRFNNLAALRRYGGPVLLIHGREDEIVPHAHSERLAEAASAAELLSLDCGHNDCPPDPVAYLRAIETFLTRAGMLGASPPGAMDSGSTR